jgi:hypothetical protein
MPGRRGSVERVKSRSESRVTLPVRPRRPKRNGTFYDRHCGIGRDTPLRVTVPIPKLLGSYQILSLCTRVALVVFGNIRLFNFR